MREKLIELLFKSLAKHIHKSCKLAENIADDLIANGVTVQQWIPVTERLPEEWVAVLVWSEYGFCEVAVYLGIPGKWRVTWNHAMLEVDSITHWMPLPEPPKEE